jgi:hypothetical protein
LRRARGSAMRHLLWSTGTIVAALIVARPGAAWTGPGGDCTTDRDCGSICGWVCSVSRGNICVPAMGGDPGHCSTDGDCACSGQTCSGSVCTPPANPECACNSDCPGEQVCDQYLFVCHTQSADSCHVGSYHGYYFGPESSGPSCGCDYTCAGGSAAPYCQPGTWIPPECSSDMDCGACHQGSICALIDGGGWGFCTEPGAGWCHGARDVSPSNLGTTTGTSGGSTAGSSSTGSSTGTSQSAAPPGGSKAAGCSSSSAGESGPICIIGVALFVAYVRRSTLKRHGSR